MVRVVAGPIELLQATGRDGPRHSATVQEQQADRSSGQQAPADEDPLGPAGDDIRFGNTLKTDDEFLSGVGLADRRRESIPRGRLFETRRCRGG